MTRLDRWQARTETPLVWAAVAFLVAYAVPIVSPSSPRALVLVCGWVITATWVLLGVDYVVRLVLSTDRRSFVRTNLLDLVTIALPVLRPLRLLRLVALLSVLNRAGAHTLRGRVATYVAGGTALLVLTGALAVTDAERGAAGATIDGFGDGLWWAATTVTTVGYGDEYPTTPTGRLVAVGLMIGGVALLGVVTASLASWLVDRVAAEGAHEASATRTQVAELSRQVEDLSARVQALIPAPGREDDDEPDR
ncbi:potassium channel family protein [Cellulomonas sp. ES6]|uniref:potassium channel family protein n=1 Tax=Cellulomonas sp. ES6 TaxID=3039384 RepID=UPI001982ACF6|nr:potassium channel family protein [Cellulomonas sp. ES6]MBD3779428.1 two pore domain potassium channel family protein [Micrococcales bacterium]WHP18365.1 potassium channel family protein [Cellulomonas sp. ES6]